jgi:hypothetical protein
MWVSSSFQVGVCRVIKPGKMYFIVGMRKKKLGKTYLVLPAPRLPLPLLSPLPHVLEK